MPFLLCVSSSKIVTDPFIGNFVFVFAFEIVSDKIYVYMKYKFYRFVFNIVTTEI